MKLVYLRQAITVENAQGEQETFFAGQRSIEDDATAARLVEKGAEDITPDSPKGLPEAATAEAATAEAAPADTSGTSDAPSEESQA